MQVTKNKNHSADKNPSVKKTSVHCTDKKSSTELTKVKVSQTTFAYMKCLQQLDTLWDCMDEALELFHCSSTTAEKIMVNEFAVIYMPIREMIAKYMCLSIGVNIKIRNEITEI
jgi:hypothetical protein